MSFILRVGSVPTRSSQDMDQEFGLHTDCQKYHATDTGRLFHRFLQLRPDSTLLRMHPAPADRVVPAIRHEVEEAEEQRRRAQCELDSIIMYLEM